MWQKDGIEFVPPLVIGGIAWYNPGGQMLVDAGYVESNPTAPETTAFDAACAQFRSVCVTIGAAIGRDGFKGGFDEYANFLQSKFTQDNPARAAMLAAMWSGANEYAKYEGQKLGYGQPEWWYKCWEE